MIQELKPSIDEVMAHHGVKGMKWGHTTAGPSGGSGGSGHSGGGKKPKPTTQEIKSARVRQLALELKYQGATGEYMTARTRKGTDAAEKTMRSLEKQYHLGKDAKTAARLTKGEKISVGLMYGVTGAIAVAMIASSGR